MSKIANKKKIAPKDIKKMIKDGVEAEAIALRFDVGFETPEFEEIFNQAIKDLSEEYTKDAPEIQYMKYVCDLFVYLKSIKLLLKQPQSVRDIAMLKKLELEVIDKIHIQARKEFGLMKTADSSGSFESSKYIKQIQDMEFEDLVRELVDNSVKYANVIQSIDPVSILEMEEPDIYSGPTEQDVIKEQKEQLEKAQAELARRAKGNKKG